MESHDFWSRQGNRLGDRAPSELSRTGLHRGAGARLSLGQMRDILAGHDLVHLDQIREGLGV